MLQLVRFRTAGSSSVTNISLGRNKEKWRENLTGEKPNTDNLHTTVRSPFITSIITFTPAITKLIFRNTLSIIASELPGITMACHRCRQN